MDFLLLINIFSIEELKKTIKTFHLTNICTLSMSEHLN